MCDNPDARNLWQTEMDKLLVWLVVIDTVPEIIEAFKAYLYHIFLQKELPTTECSDTITYQLYYYSTNHGVDQLF